MTVTQKLKRQINQIMDHLPESSLVEVATFIEYLQYQKVREASKSDKTPYVPVALGGLWQGVQISDDELAETRREMWSDFGYREI